ncbi:MAG: hypothetical protein KAS99_06715 [Candidatus Omnitrophica bacterium]|nr:hypothetical protein [Candidatus Omnitrophota bacterium]
MKYVDPDKRESRILNLAIEGYIKESRPISSSYLCEKFNLPYSTATVRNILGALEKRGLLSHIHTSSGRVPTQEGFRHYVDYLIGEEIITPDEFIDAEVDVSDGVEELLNNTVDVLAVLSGYTSLLAISGLEERFLFRGARFIFEQPEFEDVAKLKSFFYALEVKINIFQDLLFNCLDEGVKVLIGKDIGCEEISGCSLVVSGFQKKKLCAGLALLGPMRMNYVKAISTIDMMSHKLQESIEDIF